MDFTPKPYRGKRTGAILLFLLLFFVSGIMSVFGQAPQLIPVDEDNNEYPITFTNDDQNEFVLHFDQDVIGGSDPSCWTIFIGSETYTPSFATPIDNTVLLELYDGNLDPISVSFDDRESVRISYDAGCGDLRNSSDEFVSSIDEEEAVNNRILSCDDITGDKGIDISSSGTCAPVSVSIEYHWNFKPAARNSVHFDPGGGRLQVHWNDPDDLIFYGVMDETYPGSGRFQRKTSVFEYPDDEDVCSYSPVGHPRLILPTQSSLICNSGAVPTSTTLASHRTDDDWPGELLIYPEVGSTLNEYCVGEDIVGHSFNDVTIFNCDYGEEPERPNVGKRWVQFEYGTNVYGGERIPNVWLDTDGDGEPDTQVTDAEGNLIGGETFLGPVIEYDEDPLPGDEDTNYPTAYSYPVFHDGDFNDEAEMQFEVTMRYWGPCNQWHTNPVIANERVITETSYIELVDAPGLPIADSPVYCYDENGQPSLTAEKEDPGSSGELNWYEDEDLTIHLHEGDELVHDKVEPGIYTFWVREEQPAPGCIGPAEEVTLTILPPIEDNIISEDQTICAESTPDELTGLMPTGGDDSYNFQWQSRAGTSGDWSDIGGATSQNYQPEALTGTRQYRRIVTSGESVTSYYCEDISNTITITVEPLPVANAGSNATICEDSDYTVNDASAEHYSSIIWTVEDGEGSLTGETTLEPTYSPDADDAGNVVTLRMTIQGEAACAGSEDWDEMTITVDPLPVAFAGDDDSTCEDSPYTISGASAQFESSILWTVETGSGSLENETTLTPTYTPAEADAGNDVVLRMTIQGENACGGEEDSDEMTLTVDPLPVAFAGGDDSTCEDSPYTISGATAQNASSILWSIVSGNGTLENEATLSPTYTPAATDAGSNVVLRMTIQGENACGGAEDSDEMILTVDPLPVAFAGGDDSTCEDNPYTISGATAQNASSILWSIVSGNGTLEDETTLAPTYTPAATDAGSDVVLRMTIQGENACGGAEDSDDMILTVDPLPAAFAGDDDSTCEDSPYTISGATAQNASSILWSIVSGDGTLENETTLAPTYTPAAADAGSDVVLSMTIQGENACGGEEDSDEMTLTVDPLPVAFAGDDDSTCEDSPYTIGGATAQNESSILWTIVSGNGSLENEATLSPTYTPAATDAGSNVVLRMTIQGENACGGAEDSDDMTLSVNPLPDDITIAPEDGLICYNTTTDIVIPSSQSGVRYYVYLASDDSEVGNVIGNGTDVSVNTGPLTVTTDFYAVAVDENHATLCERTLNTVTVNVNPIFELAEIEAEATSICLNHPATIRFDLTGGVSPYTVTYTANGNTHTINDYESGDWIVTDELDDDTEFTITYVEDVNGCEVEVYGDPIEIIVGSEPESATIDGSGDACEGTESFIVIVIDGGAPNFTIEYEINSVQQAPILDYESGTQHSLGTLDAGTYNIVTTGIEDWCENEVPEAGLPGTYTINIDPIPSAVETVNHAPVICNDGTTDIELDSDVAETDFEWTVSFDPSVSWTTGKAPEDGSRSDGIGTRIEQNLEHEENEIVTVIYSIYPTGPGETACPGDATEITAIVEPTPRAAISNDNQVICDGGTLTAMEVSSLTSTDGAQSFDMTIVATEGDIGDLTATESALDEVTGEDYPYTIDGTLQNNTDDAITIEYRVIPKLAGCADGQEVVATVTIEPTPRAAISNDNQVICDGGTLTAMEVSSLTSTDGAQSFDMTIVATEGDIGDLTATGTALDEVIDEDYSYTIDGTLQNNTDDAITIEYRVIPKLAGCADGQQVVATVTIEPTPRAAISNNNQVICDGGSLTAMEVSSLTLTEGAQSFDMTIVATEGDIGDLSATGSALDEPAGESYPYTIDGTLQNNTDDAITIEYRVIPKLAGCADGQEVVATVTIEPTPEAAISNNDQTICNESAIDDMVVSSLVTTSGSQSFDMDIVALDGADLNDLEATGNALTTVMGGDYDYTISGSLTNNSDEAITIEYSVIPRLGTCPEGEVVTATVTVEPSPKANIENTKPDICNGDEVDMSITSPTGSSDPGELLFNLEVSSSDEVATGGTAYNNLSDQSFPLDITGTLTNSSVDPVTVTFTVYPRIGTECTGNSFTTTVVVNPTPLLTSPLSIPAVCSSTPFVYVPDSETAGTSFEWVRETVAGISPEGPVSGDDDIDETLVNRTSETIDVTYVYTLEANGCSNEQSVVVPVKPEPVVTEDQETDVCSGNPAGYDILLDNFTNPGDNVTFSWPEPVLEGGLEGGSARPVGEASSEPIGDVFTNTSGEVLTATYTVTPYYDGCEGEPVEVVVNVGAQPVLDPDLDKSACSGTEIDLILDVADGSVPATHYEITERVVSGGLVADGGNAEVPFLTDDPSYLAEDKFLNEEGEDLTVTYTVIPRYGDDCIGDPVDVEVTVNPQPVIDPASESICSNTEPTITVESNIDGSEFEWEVVNIDGDISGTSLGNTGTGAEIGETLINNSHTEQAFVTYRFVATGPPELGSCTGFHEDIVITVNPLPAPNSIDGAETVCQETNKVVYDVEFRENTDYGWTWDGVGVRSYGGNSQDNFIVFSYPDEGDHQIRMVETNEYGCSGNENVIDVYVAPVPEAEPIVGDDAVCENSSGSYSVSLTENSDYLWFVPPGTSILSGESGPENNEIEVMFGSTSGDIRVRETNEHGCEGPWNLLSVTIESLPQIFSVTGGGSYCEGGEGVSIGLSGSESGVEYELFREGESTSVIVEGDGSPLDFGLQTEPGSYTVYVTSTAGPTFCSGDMSGSRLVTVNPLPEVELYSSEDPGNEICDGEPVTFTASGASTYEFFVDADSRQGPSSNNTFTSEQLNDGEVVTVVGTDNNGCSATSEEIEMQVNPIPDVTVLNKAPAICDGDFTDIELTGSVEDTEFYWDVTVSDPGLTGASSDGSGTLTDIEQQLFNSTDTDHTATYTITPRANGCEGSQVVVEVTVSPSTSIISDPVDMTVCEGDNAVFSVEAAGADSYQWWEDDGDGAVEITDGGKYDGAGTDQLTISDVTADMDGYSYHVTVSGCDPDIPSDNATLTVNTGPEITTEPEPADVCEGDRADFEVEATGSEIVYQWQISTDGGSSYTNLSDAGPYSGTDTENLAIEPVSLSIDNYIYRVVVDGVCGDPAVSAGVPLTVPENPSVTAHPLSETACEGSDVEFFVSASGDITGYQWEVSTDGGLNYDPLEEEAPYSGTQTADLLIEGVDASLNGYRYRAVVYGDCEEVTSGNAVLQVNIAPEIISGPETLREICEGSNTNFSVNATGSNLTYQWQVDEGGGFTDITDGGVYSGSESNMLSIWDATPGMDEYLYRVIVSGSCDPAATSTEGELRVGVAPDITLQPDPQTICEGGDVAMEFEAGGTDLDIIWQYSNDGGTVFHDLSDDATYQGTDTERLEISNVTAVLDNYLYRAMITGECPPSVATDAVSLTVDTEPQITNEPSDQNVCEGGDADFSVDATGTDITYQWQVDEGGGFTDISDGGYYSGTDTPDLIVTGADNAIAGNSYRVVVTGKCGSPAISAEALLTVDYLPEVTDPAEQEICEGGDALFTVDASGTEISYRWEMDTGSGWQPVPGSYPYSGVNTSELSIVNASVEMDGNLYRVRVTGKCSPEAVSDEAALIVNTNPQPSPLPDPANTAVGVPLQLEGNPQGGSGTYDVHEWTGDVTELDDANIENPEFTASAEGEYNLTYRVVDSKGCSGSAEMEVTVSVTLEVEIVPDPAIVCADDELHIVATPSGGSGSYLSHHWSGDGAEYLSDESVRNPVFNSPYGGTYTLIYEVVDSYGTVATETLEVTVNARPTANITGDGAFPFVCGGTDLQLDGNASGGSGTYTNHQWSGDVGPLSSTSEEDPVFSTVVGGSYNLSYTVTDSEGCTSEPVSTVITNEIPSALFSADETDGCTPLTVTFENNSMDAEAYHWDFGDGNESEEADPVHTFENNTSTVQYYNVELTAFSENGCEHTHSQVITVYPGISAEITTSDESVCSPAGVKFSTVPGALSYYWDFDDGTHGYFGANVGHEFTNDTDEDITRTVSLLTTSFYGCEDYSEIDIVVHSTPQAQFSADPAYQVFPDATVEFTNEGSSYDGLYYSWDFGDGSTSDDENPVHTYDGPGDYEVTLEVSNENCSNSVTHSVTVAATPPVASFEAVAPDCAPMTVQFENTSEYSDSWKWDFGDGGVSIEENPEHTFYSPGMHLVRLTSYGPGGSDQASDFVNVLVTPTSYFHVAPTYVYANDQHVATFNVSREGKTYLWDFGDGTTSNDFEPIHTYTEAGIYDVSLEVWTEDGCYHSFTREEAVEVEASGEIVYPTAFRPGNEPTGGAVDPNADEYERNKVFIPGIADQVDDYHLTVYTRWGELIFESRDPNVGWDGFINGVKAKQDVYIWKVRGKYSSGEAFIETGDVTLLR